MFHEHHNRYLVSTEQVKTILLERGVGEAKIEITGIPVHPNFWERHSKQDIRNRLGLNDLPTILIMGGGWGLTKDATVNNLLVKHKEHLQLIFCFGSNMKLMEKMSNDPRFHHQNIKLLGFTKEIDKLMEVSDLLITKPGGMTCSEGLAKAIPMLFHKPLPGQEEENLLYFSAQGWGTPIHSLDDITIWVDKLIHNYEEVSAKRDQMLSDIEGFHPEQSAMAIVELLESREILV